MSHSHKAVRVSPRLTRRSILHKTHDEDIGVSIVDLASWGPYLNVRV